MLNQDFSLDWYCQPPNMSFTKVFWLLDLFFSCRSLRTALTSSRSGSISEIHHFRGENYAAIKWRRVPLRVLEVGIDVDLFLLQNLLRLRLLQVSSLLYRTRLHLLLDEDLDWLLGLGGFQPSDCHAEAAATLCKI
jgi:hypothetical protein